MLSDIKDKFDWSNLTDAESEELCKELRLNLVRSVAQTGGHLASNLGAVEITVALHRVYDTAKDRIVFDVGHQCYVHKMMTGRADKMNTMRQLNGLAGFPKPSESVHDAFIAGHASNSISVALGMAKARTLLKQNYEVIALIGDGALTGGLAYEGLSNAGQSNEKMLIIVNDNGMSIKKNVGGVAKLLAHQRLKPTYLSFKNTYYNCIDKMPFGSHFNDGIHFVKQMIKSSLLPSVFFEDLGFKYLGPVDGHNVSELTRILKYIKEDLECPVVLHIRTTKGKGYEPAERVPSVFHGVSPFDVKTGKTLKPSAKDFSAVFGESLVEIAKNNSKVCAITAAMQSGTGLEKFAEKFPNRCFDVGIAEGHAVAMCGGMAKQGLVPVFAVYSTFLQRSYDMLMHDIAIGQLHAVFAVDRAGLVGADGETHQGLYDVAFLSSVPNMRILAPASFEELKNMLDWAINKYNKPVAVRYPRGGENNYSGCSAQQNTVLLNKGDNITVVTYGILTGEVLQAIKTLNEIGITCDVFKLNCICPIDDEDIIQSVIKTKKLVVIEEIENFGCVGNVIASNIAKRGIKADEIRLLNCGDNFVQHGTVPQLRKIYSIDKDGIIKNIREMA